MAKTYEHFTSRTLTVDNHRPVVTRKYYISEVNTEQAALNALLDSGLCPATLDVTAPDAEGKSAKHSLKRLHMEVSEEITSTKEKDFIWSGTVKYALPDVAVEDGKEGEISWTRPPAVRWSFSMYTESTIQRAALFGQKKFGNGPDFGGLIGVVNRGGETSVEGAPALIPAGMLRGSKTYTAKEWNNIVAKSHSTMCKVNEGSFSAGGMTFAPGELLMVGAESRMDSAKNVEVEFQFLFSPSSSGTIDGIPFSKKGWQYLWAYSEPAMKNGVRTHTARGVYVADIYDSASFGGLFS